MTGEPLISGMNYGLKLVFECSGKRSKDVLRFFGNNVNLIYCQEDYLTAECILVY